MKKLGLVFLGMFFFYSNFYPTPLQSSVLGEIDVPFQNSVNINRDTVVECSTISIQDFFESFHANGLNFEAFKAGLLGYNKLKEEGKLLKTNILTIADFSKPSKEERLFVLDLVNHKVLIQSLVSHGKNTGESLAKLFSNVAESNKSSLGFYVTAETYNGKNGFSLKLDGMEPGINDNARERGIVMHAADYVSWGFAAAQGYIGRSQGCPALPKEKSQKVINLIKNKSCFFIYSDNNSYLQSSKLLHNFQDDDLAALIQELS